MINDLYIPTPLEDYPEKERLEICKSRMDSYIEQQYREGGLGTKVPNESSKVRTRMDRISYCRSLWNNNIDEQRYDYLYNKVNKTISDQDGIDRVITMEMPAKVRHIPIVRPKLQALISKELSRPLVMRTVGIDEASVNKKIQEEIDGVWIKQMEKFAQRRAAQQAQQLMLQQQQQLMQQIQQVPGAEGMIIEMQSQLEMIAEIVNKEAALTEEEVKKIRKYYKYSYKLFEEDLADSAIKEYIDRHRLRRLKNDAFTEQMITGEPIYFCDWEQGMEEPQSRLVRPEFYWYQYNSGAKFLKDLD